jgi:hypothetical protein
MTSFKPFHKSEKFLENSMTNVQPNTAATASSQKIVAKDIHTKWDKISEQEAGSVKSSSDLMNQVQTKYGLNAEQAKSQVDTWANGRSF